MKCPQCEGSFDPVTLSAVNGGNRYGKRCDQCGGFWFQKGQDEGITEWSVKEIDPPQPNYSLQSYSLVCPDDETMLEEVDSMVAPIGSRIWRCPDCQGTFYPRGQLALAANARHSERVEVGSGLYGRSHVALATVLTIIGAALTVAATQNIVLDASPADPLPTSGPSFLTLVLLALAYLSGTVLAVLGKRIALILMGWGVIAICLFGFFVVILGP